MADPLTIIGSLGALCNVIDAVGKTITVINALRGRWKNGDLIFVSLASQLVALRAALSKVQEWMTAEGAEIHHQLAMDLDVSISCCKVLVDSMDTFFSQIDRSTEKPLDVLGKLKVTFGAGGIDELQKLVERQTSALTLLLTACNCKALSEQKQLLETPKSRQTLERAKADSASLIVHLDSTSFRSKCTDTMSKISVIFGFDNAVFSSKVYERVFRSSLKHDLRRRQERHVQQSVQRPHLPNVQVDELHLNLEEPKNGMAARRPQTRTSSLLAHYPTRLWKGSFTTAEVIASRSDVSSVK